MPELPEVETVCQSLKPFLVGRKIEIIKVLRDKSFPQIELLDKCLNTEIKSLERRAKFIDLQFNNDYHLLTHLKMTGQLLYKSQTQLAGGGHPTADILQQLPGRHTRIIYDLNDGGKLFFNDLRVFGWMRVLTSNQIREEYAKLGPDANTDISVSYLQEKFSKRSQKIKQVIMDNEVWCGLGNIYASEILFACSIDPLKPAKNLTLKEIERIIDQTKLILADAIAHRGTTFDGKYVDAEGKNGNFVEKLKVYGRDGQTCLNCTNILQKIKIGGRTTVFCPICQK